MAVRDTLVLFDIVASKNNGLSSSEKKQANQPKQNLGPYSEDLHKLEGITTLLFFQLLINSRILLFLTTNFVYNQIKILVKKEIAVSAAR